MSEHTIATALVKAQRTHKRKAADFYPTPADVTEALMLFLQLAPSQCVWEPASGDGAMARIIERHCEDVWATDLRSEPSIYGQLGRDFLNADVPYGFKPDWIITNPPFNLAEAFIRRALSVTPNVAMLLSNQYWHAATRKKLFDDHPPAFVLPLLWRPAFLEKERGKSPMMNVIWVVWREGENDTLYRLLTRPDVEPLEPLYADFEDLLGHSEPVSGYSTVCGIEPELEDLL